MFTVSVPQLSLHVPRNVLPVHLGGSLKINHSTWLLHCFASSMTNREDELLATNNHQATTGNGNIVVVTSSINSNITSNSVLAGNECVCGSTGGIEQTNNGDGDADEDDDEDDDAILQQQQQQQKDQQQQQQDANSQLSELWSENPPSSASSGFSDDDSLAGAENGDLKTISQIVDMVRERGRQGLVQEYAIIRCRAPDGTFTNARYVSNNNKFIVVTGQC